MPYLPSLIITGSAHGTKRNEQYSNTGAKIRHVKFHAVTRTKDTRSQRLQSILDSITALCTQITRGTREGSIGCISFCQCTTIHVEGLAIPFEIMKCRGTHCGIFVWRGRWS